MNTTSLPNTLPHDAPDVIFELRSAFDARHAILIAVARQQSPSSNPVIGHDTSSMYHIDFPHHQLQMTAMYDAAQDRFTQLVGRYADEAHHERPSLTISLFL